MANPSSSQSVSTQDHLISATNAFFLALASNTCSLTLLTHFSTTHPVTIQHAPALCPHPQTSRLSGLNAVRSYFDLLATNWTRSKMAIRTNPRADAKARRVVVGASVTWMWRRSGREWDEDFTCTLEFDENYKISSFVVKTDSAPETCVMRAVDSAVK